MQLLMVGSSRTITLWRESAFRTRTWLKQFQLTAFLSPLYPSSLSFNKCTDAGSHICSYIFPTTLNKRTPADKIIHKKTFCIQTIFLTLLRYSQHVPRASLASVSFVLCLLLVASSAAHGWRPLCGQLETALGGPGISSSCVVHELSWTALSRCIPWPCVFFILLSHQQLTEALWILPKQGCWWLALKGSGYLLQPVKPSRSAKLLLLYNGYCLWFPPGWELPPLDEWSLPHRELSAQSDSAQSINCVVELLLDPSLKAQNCMSAPAQERAKGQEKKSEEFSRA